MSIQVVSLATASVITASVSLIIYLCIPKHLDTDILFKHLDVCNNKPFDWKIYSFLLGQHNCWNFFSFVTCAHKYSIRKNGFLSIIEIFYNSLKMIFRISRMSFNSGWIILRTFCGIETNPKYLKKILVDCQSVCLCFLLKY